MYSGEKKIKVFCVSKFETPEHEFARICVERSLRDLIEFTNHYESNTKMSCLIIPEAKNQPVIEIICDKGGWVRTRRGEGKDI